MKRERERETETETERQRDREREFLDFNVPSAAFGHLRMNHTFKIL